MPNRAECISLHDYTRLCKLVYQEAGIALGSERRTMLEVRIKRRLKELAISSYGRYCDYLFSHHGMREELVHLIDVVTTNKTDFFREPRHFGLLTESVLPGLIASTASRRPLLVWSAGCSTGEEPYTLAMVLAEYGLSHAGFSFRVLATDLSTTVLAKAELGVYSTEAIRPVPGALRARYFMRSRNPGSNRVRVVPELRRLVQFRRLNFMDAEYGLTENADVIFCRNVIIYFDRPTQQSVLKKLTTHLEAVINFVPVF
jgi:chemotaxis protein methyltransferase CheR